MLAEKGHKEGDQELARVCTPALLSLLSLLLTAASRPYTLVPRPFFLSLPHFRTHALLPTAALRPCLAACCLILAALPLVPCPSSLLMPEAGSLIPESLLSCRCCLQPLSLIYPDARSPVFPITHYPVTSYFREAARQ